MNRSFVLKTRIAHSIAVKVLKVVRSSEVVATEYAKSTTAIGHKRQHVCNLFINVCVWRFYHALSHTGDVVHMNRSEVNNSDNLQLSFIRSGLLTHARTIEEGQTQPSNTRCFSASSSLGRAKATQHRHTGETSPVSPSITISPSDEHTGRMGNLYLFNSLPQPTPTHAWKKLDNGIKKDKQSPLWDVENALSPQVAGVERVSVDRQAIREITSKELELKAALAGVPSPRTPDAPLKSPKLLSPLVISTRLLGNTPNIGNSKSPSPRPSPVTDKLSSIAAPLDLAEYDQSDDLSASFEASLLASLKEAAAGVACRQSGLELGMEANGISNAFTMTIDKKPVGASEKLQECPAELRPRLKIPPHHGKPGLIMNSPIPQTPENLQLRKLIENEFQTDMSYSDDDTSMATTTAGLGSLLDSPFPENYVKGSKKKYPGFPSRKGSFNPEANLGAQLLHTDDISVHPSRPANRRQHADEGWLACYAVVNTPFLEMKPPGNYSEVAWKSSFFDFLVRSP
ncbi:hypothetical protein CLF_107741 [Clonorchis sinensis]|uniref:Uncharacterized protein n=1 Tax=Clonorchis sinensis TaxID=79923 RepID=G7YH48_CLOSI|nr:hypothetical protein CLF_107741 [Clonorchis sinensis]